MASIFNTMLCLDIGCDAPRTILEKDQNPATFRNHRNHNILSLNEIIDILNELPNTGHNFNILKFKNLATWLGKS